MMVQKLGAVRYKLSYISFLLKDMLNILRKTLIVKHNLLLMNMQIGHKQTK